MKKRTVNLVILILFLIFIGNNNIESESLSIAEKKESTFEELNYVNSRYSDFGVTSNSYNDEIWQTYSILALVSLDRYSDGTEVTSNLNTALSWLYRVREDGSYLYNSVSLTSPNEWRWIGRTPEGYLINNPNYPEDHIGMTNINSYNWQVNSDNFTKLISIESTVEGLEWYRTEIINFLTTKYGNSNISSAGRFDPTEDPNLWIDRAIVIIPATQYGRGSIRLQHLWDSDGDGVDENWYITVNLQSIEQSKLGKQPINGQCNIEAPYIVGPLATTTNGTFTFEFNSIIPLVSYEILNTDPNIVVNGPLFQSISGETYSGLASITISLPTDHTSISLSVKGMDGAGNEVIVSDSALINKVAISSGSGNMNSNATGVLMADTRGEEAFDVLQGIPSSENLYANIFTREYLVDLDYEFIQDVATYQVNVSRSYDYQWNGGTDNNDSPVTKSYIVTRPYGYFEVNSLAVYGLDSVTVENDMLTSDSISISPVDYQLPTTDFQDKSTYIEAGLKSMADLNATSIKYKSVTYNESTDTYEVVLKSKMVEDMESTVKPNTPSEDFRNKANKIFTDVLISSDYLEINGSVIFDGTKRAGSDTIPGMGELEEAPMTHEDMLFLAGIEIEDSILNGTYTTVGSVNYSKIYNFNDSSPNIISHNINGIGTGMNEVVVHTPVVCYPKLDEISRESQLVEMDLSELQLIIEETFHVDYPTVGEHLNIPGYGRRDYEKYILAKQIQFPFDVYVGEGYDGLYFPKDTWGNFSSLENNFFIPSWVEEGNGHILYRAIALNTPSLTDPNYNYNANLDQAAYKAVEAMACNVSGKITELSITDCGDDFWKNNFDASLDKIMSVGTKTDETRTLPILPGKTYIEDGEEKTYDGVMLGYPINFEVLTNGDMMDQNDLVYIKPSFEYVPLVLGLPDMSAREKVDLYVSEFEGLKVFDSSIVLTEYQREFIGNPVEKDSSISKDIKEESIQVWQGKFYLPNMTYVVPEGYDLTSLNSLDLEKDPFLHEGYIIVNFDIRAYDQVTGLSDEMKLSFQNVKKSLEEVVEVDAYIETQTERMIYGVGFDEEGYDILQGGLDLKQGDMVFYSTDKRASQTYY